MRWNEKERETNYSFKISYFDLIIFSFNQVHLLIFTYLIYRLLMLKCAIS